MDKINLHQDIEIEVKQPNSYVYIFWMFFTMEFIASTFNQLNVYFAE